MRFRRVVQDSGILPCRWAFSIETPGEKIHAYHRRSLLFRRNLLWVLFRFLRNDKSGL